MSTSPYKSGSQKRTSEIPTQPRRLMPVGRVYKIPAEASVRNQLALSAAVAVGGQLTEKRLVPRKQMLQILALAVLALLFVTINGLTLWYLRARVSLPEMLPDQVQLKIPPHYYFSMYGLDRPGSVSISPSGDRIYIAEMDGERLIKMFDTNGNLLGSFSPPRTTPPERAPVYIAAGPSGKVFVSDRAQHAIFIYDSNGIYQDTILSPTLTLSEYISKHIGGLPVGTIIAYNAFQENAYYQKPGEDWQSIPAPDFYDWAPLGLRFDHWNRLVFTDVGDDRSFVQVLPENVMALPSLEDFAPVQFRFGAYGQDSGGMVYPNSAVVDSKGRTFVSDGNNSRISVWDVQGNFLFEFGRGTGSSALNLPRGLLIDSKDRLYIVDAVGQSIKVYDVSQQEVNFLFSFGEFGVNDGQFNYPNDIAMDKEGRLFIADRENNRVQVWIY